MNPISKQTGRRRFSSALARRTATQYLTAVATLVLSLAVFVVLCVILCNARTWYLLTPLESFVYFTLKFIENHLLIICISFLFLGTLVIGLVFLRRLLRYLDELIDAARQLVEPSAQQPITLSSPLLEVAEHLNAIRLQSVHNSMLAKEAEQRKNDLIVYLAHDLKTPLTSVIGYLSLLQDEPELTQRQRAKYTGIALAKAQRLEELINEFFEITRFNLSRLTLETRCVDLTRMLEQITNEFEPVLEENHLTYQLHLPAKLPCVCDDDKLARVFDNLLRNACFYSFADSCIDICATQTDANIILTFENSGHTIPPEKLERLFDQFFRLDRARGTQKGGAGLGLAIAKQLIQLHGGTIGAFSADNRIRFVITLPLDCSHAATTCQNADMSTPDIVNQP